MLEQMSNGRIKQIQPSINPLREPRVSYPEANGLMNIDPEQTKEILESLARENILKKKFFDKLLKCPKCGSLNLKFSMVCPHCGSPDTSRGEVLEHFSCGYSGPESEFWGESGKYVCPKCKKELKSIGVDYAKLGLLCICHDCGERFREPEQKWRCFSCSKTFPTAELEETNVYSYEFNAEKKDWLRIQLGPKRQMQEFLNERGYKVLSNEKIKGSSGTEHLVELFAMDGIFGGKIVISHCEELNFEKIVALHAVAEDLSARAILITQKAPGDELKRLAERLNVAIYKGEDLEAMLRSR